MSVKHKQGISSAFNAHLVEMQESPAWRVLSLSARLLLDRLEIEHRSHAGRENGRLQVTYLQFVEYGLHKESIGPAIREVEALGFAEVTERGEAGLGRYRKANRFRLTYMPYATAPGDGTHEWRRFKDMTLAETAAIAAEARKKKPEAAQFRPAEERRSGLRLVAAAS
jgi:hypothetical protein